MTFFRRPEKDYIRALLDPLSLSAEALSRLRKGLALMCLLDCLQRAAATELFYSDLGLLPRYRAHLLMLGTSKMSIHLISGWPWVVTAIFLATAGIAVTVLRGNDQRWHRVALWALMTSAQTRNPLLCDAADDLLRLMLFWDIFLPNSPETKDKHRVLSPATLGYQAQLSIALAGCALVLGDPSRIETLNAQTALGYPPSWLGGVESVIYGVGAICLWNRRLRRPWMVSLAAILLLRAATLHPVFPLTVAVASLGLWEPKASGPLSSVVLPPWPSGLALSAILVATLSAFTANEGHWVARPLKTSSEILGLHQDWSQIYPLPSPLYRAEFTRRGDRQPLLQLGPEQGRRAALFSQRLVNQPRVAASALDARALKSPSRAPLDLWQLREDEILNFQLSRTQRHLAATAPVRSSR